MKVLKRQTKAKKTVAATDPNVKTMAPTGTIMDQWHGTAPDADMISNLILSISKTGKEILNRNTDIQCSKPEQ